MATLSRNDALVLSALFDAESKPSNMNITINPHTINSSSTTSNRLNSSTLASLRSRENAAIRPLNVPSPSREIVLTAIKSLSGLIAEEPSYASAYNNRAQALRLLDDDEAGDSGIAGLEAGFGGFVSVWSDLSTAVELAESDVLNRSGVPIEDAERVLGSAYTQRGWLLLRASMAVGEKEKGEEKEKEDDATTSPTTTTSIPKAIQTLPPPLQHKTSNQLETLAAKEFSQGGKYGNSIARSMAVKLNPTAKLCGEIVKEAMVGDMKARLEEERAGLR